MQMKYSIQDLLRSSAFACCDEVEHASQMPFAFPRYLDGEMIELPNRQSKRKRVYFVGSSLLQVMDLTIHPEGPGSMDTRKTCMIKNIPNKYNIYDLIDYINMTHYGTYDFLYLRMDFKNNCNVGYAFINFVDTKYVFSFYNRIHGMKWMNIGSRKIAELKYATIQGLENLIQKFASSKIMNEQDVFRPKIFSTSGRNKGFEIDWDLLVKTTPHMFI